MEKEARKKALSSADMGKNASQALFGSKEDVTKVSLFSQGLCLEEMNHSGTKLFDYGWVLQIILEEIGERVPFTIEEC